MVYYITDMVGGAAMKAADKSSGRKCAYSIVARNLADKLIEDGILNNPIVRVPRENNTDIVFCFERNGYYYRVSSKWLAERPDDEPLWTPSFIDRETWESAAKAFRPQHDLKYNVEHYLLPVMEGYLSGVTDDELNALVRDFLLHFAVLNSPIRQISGNTFYFNDDEIYTLDKGSQLFPYEGRLKFHLFTVRDYSSFNMNVWAKAAKKFALGMTLTECIRIFLDTEMESKPVGDLAYIDRLIQHIHPPEYERVPENMNEATFDRIRVSVGLPRFMFQTWAELRAAVRENRKEIDQRVIRRIEDDRQFQKYKIPINFIELSEVLLRKNYSLEYIFELKRR